MYALALLLLLLPLLPAFAQGAVYRCPGPDGQTSYRDRPCPGGQRIDVGPTSPQAPPGLRPDERELLRQLQQPTPTPARPAPAPAPETCPGIRLLSVRPYSYDSTTVVLIDGRPYRQLSRHQCAALRLDTDAYYGLLRETVADKLRGRLYAVFADGATAAADELTLKQAPARMGPQERLGARACFGTGSAPIVEVGCH